MSDDIRVALHGFSAFERDALRSYFRLAAARTPSYTLVEAIDDAVFVIADADRADLLQALRAAGRDAETVFVGAGAPDEALARLPRPLDPRLIVRELDALAARAGVLAPQPAPTAAQVSPAVAFTTAAALRASEPLDVLIVDDSEVAQRFVARLVEQLGLRPSCAGDSQSALALLAQQRFAFALLDVALGEGSSDDGLWLCRRIKQQPDAPHVVMVTAAAQAVDRVLGSLAGCDAYLTKPIDAAEFGRTLASLLPAAFARSGAAPPARPGGE